MGTNAPRPPVAGNTFVVGDYRHPGRPMAALQIKLPVNAIDDLGHRAQALGCSRGALARDLIVRGLAQLAVVANQVEA